MLLFPSLKAPSNKQHDSTVQSLLMFIVTSKAIIITTFMDENVKKKKSKKSGRNEFKISTKKDVTEQLIII